MALAQYHSQTREEYERLTCGLLAKKTGAFSFDHGSSGVAQIPLTEFLLPTVAVQPDALCISGYCNKSDYGIHAGFRTHGENGRFIQVFTAENANPSAVTIGDNIDGASVFAASNLDYGQEYYLKSDVNADRVKAYTDDANCMIVPAVALTGLTAARFTAPGPNPGDQIGFVRDVIVTRNNAITFRNMKESISVRVTINANAPVIVNIDTDGNGALDLGATRFPFVCKYEIFAGPDASVRKTMQFTVLASYGGDIIGRSRKFLELGAFTPKTLKGLLWWLDPDKLAGVDGDPVNQWLDASGGNHTFAKVGTAPSLDATTHSRACVTFGAGLMPLLCDVPGMRVPTQTFAIVFKPMAAPGFKGYFSLVQNGAAAGFNVSANSGSSALAVYCATNGTYLEIPGATQALCLLYLEYDEASGKLFAYLNGSANPVATANLTIPFGTATPSASLGTFYNDVDGSNAFLPGACQIGEIVSYDKIHSPADRARLATLLQERWGNVW